MKKIFITCAAILALFSSCTSVLDKEDLSSISEDKVWVDKTLTTAFLNALYVSIPSWDTAVADATDEATGGGNWTQGTTTPDNMSDTKDSAPTWYWPYSDIRNCNIFIQNAQNPEVCTIDRELADLRSPFHSCLPLFRNGQTLRWCPTDHYPARNDGRPLCET